MIVLLDNYDSFTHNLYQFLRELTDEEVQVVRNDKTTVKEIRMWGPSRIVLSPGPGRPEEAGIMEDVVRAFTGEVPILGICLGHQAIAHAFGASIVAAGSIVHGKAQSIDLDGKGLFRYLAPQSTFTRYHSLAVDPATVPEGFEVSARSADGEIMGIRHVDHVVEGVQFHPESIASEEGKRLLRNFLNYRREPFDFRTVLTSAIAGEDLGQDRAAAFMEELTEGNLSATVIAAVLSALATKGPTAEEIAGCASVLRRKRVPIESDVPTLDTCGTGGDGLGTFNISSMAALVASAAGARVAKHGNRAVSSKSGSADFYRELGMTIDLPPAASQTMLADHDFAFLFAPVYHGAMRFAAPVRRELKVKTIMNLLGPLVNPSGAKFQVIGVYDRGLMRTMAEAALLLGVERGMIVHGDDGEDELSVTGPSTVVDFSTTDGLKEYRVDPADYGIPAYGMEDLLGGDGAENARLATAILNGGGSAAIKDAVALNAGAALVVYGAAEDLGVGYAAAKGAIEDGRVKAKLDAVVAATRAAAQAATPAAAK